MNRLHLFEIHDYPWCPAVLRNGLTDFLAYNIESNDLYGPIRPILEDAIKNSGSTQVVDLCSGAGGPWRQWTSTNRIAFPVVLTDKYPNFGAATQAQTANLSYLSQSIDAMSVPAELSGFRTIFTAFHHFTPGQARAIIKDAVSKGQPIGIFEFTFRSVFALIFMLLSPFAVWGYTPKLPNKGWRKLLLTYLLPAIPALVTFDGVVSCLRTYRPEELERLTEGADYVIVQGTRQGEKWPLPITYFVAYPRRPNP